MVSLTQQVAFYSILAHKQLERDSPVFSEFSACCKISLCIEPDAPASAEFKAVSDLAGFPEKSCEQVFD
jgi:hypothetical protein